MGSSLKVAVIGAGLAGLVAARELKREGHRVVVFEKSDRLGGTWLYDPRVDSDQLGLDQTRNIIHNSLYFSLRTNLPRQLMGFTDFPFVVRENGDPRMFPGHEEVLRFLNDFANEFEIIELIRFQNEVVRVDRVDSEGDKWIVESKKDELELVSELFEAVVVCNGHHTVPILPHLPGIEKWPGKKIHSHNYRHPTPYQNQVVVIIGSGPSAFDISREIAKVAKEVHLSSRSPDIVNVSRLENHLNMWQHSKVRTYSERTPTLPDVCVRTNDYLIFKKILQACEDGIIQFEDGSSVLADTILYCTGYNYSFPFLKTNGALSIEEKRVGPLYKHVFPPSLAPRLSFVGIPSRVLVSFVWELQSKWIASVLSGKLQLPSEEEMLIDVEKHYQYMQDNGIPKHHTHLFDLWEVEYQNWLAAQVGVPQVEQVLKTMYKQTIMDFLRECKKFRDECDP